MSLPYLTSGFLLYFFYFYGQSYLSYGKFGIILPCEWTQTPHSLSDGMQHKILQEMDAPVFPILGSVLVWLLRVSGTWDIISSRYFLATGFLQLQITKEINENGLGRIL
jgi:hypothetical protein